MSVLEVWTTVVRMLSVPTSKEATHALVFLDIKETAECALVRTTKESSLASLIILAPPVLDIDECAMGTDNCDVNADCVNTEGSFICNCRTGFQQDGRICRGIQKKQLPTQHHPHC